jgi:hypothetical protein
MAKIGDHCKDCKKFLKNEMREVHEFLDQYSMVFPVWHFVDYHRTFLHNSYGLSVITAKYGKLGRYAAIIHLTRDYVEGTIDHWTMYRILEDFPRRLMWFDAMQHAYEPEPHVVRGWDGKGLVSLLYE